jgi:hypothetical protein
MKVWAEVESGHPGTLEGQQNQESILSEADLVAKREPGRYPSVSPSFGNLESGLFRSKEADPIQIMGNDEQPNGSEVGRNLENKTKEVQKKPVPELMSTPMTFKDYKNQPISVTDLVGHEKQFSGASQLQKTDSLRPKQTNEMEAEVKNIDIAPLDSNLIDEFEDVPTVKDKASPGDPFSELKSKEVKSMSLGSKKEGADSKDLAALPKTEEAVSRDKAGPAQTLKNKPDVEDSSESDF